MQYDKKKYERQIKESRLFELDRETQYTAFKREAYKMVEYLYCYLLAVNKQKYEEYGCEITKIATLCINNFRRDKGDFLHYFNAAWKLEYQHIMGNQTHIERFHGLKVTEEEKRAVSKYIRLATNIDAGISDETLYLKLAAAMEIPVEKVRKLAQMAIVQISSDTYVNEAGEIRIIWDQLAGNISAEASIYEKETIKEILFAINQVFQGLQQRQKPIISDMITIKLCDQLSETQSSQYSFVSKEIMDAWTTTGVLPTQREIAKKYGRDEASISRSVKDFLNKLRKEVRLDGIK
ncbi:hypothetical protein B5E56_00710 [Flavonifractor sp. An112]|uniref:hypothetical protein n=1 Tax=Flavonifractor sp. An112 TaxID=1965544 RepID=UPI000B39C1BF|nr:hypothetical protein [Flavonifractor sp. An112]OUQ61829.1 hypothetical protein B5E56_00710 [Flavonifractor sp. An112]